METDVNHARHPTQSTCVLAAGIWHRGPAIRKDPRIDATASTGFGSSAFFQSQSCRRRNAPRVMLPIQRKHDNTTPGTTKCLRQWYHVRWLCTYRIPSYDDDVFLQRLYRKYLLENFGEVTAQHHQVATVGFAWHSQRVCDLIQRCKSVVVDHNFVLFTFQKVVQHSYRRFNGFPCCSHRP